MQMLPMLGPPMQPLFDCSASLCTPSTSKGVNPSDVVICMSIIGHEGLAGGNFHQTN